MATQSWCRAKGLVIDGATGRTVAVTYEQSDAPLVAAAPDLLAVVNEFIRDIDAVGVKQTAEEWPDLVVTYRKALAAVSKLDE
jgi:hypothetical protein